MPALDPVPQPRNDEPHPARESAPRLRLVLAPTWDSPAESAGAGRAPKVAGQQSLDLTFVLPGGLPAVPDLPDPLHLPAPRRFGVDEAEAAARACGRSVLPPIGPWAARLAQAVLEVCTAGRPVAQLLRWTEPEVYRELEARYAPRAQRRLDRRRAVIAEHVRSVHVCEPADGIAEVSVVIGGGERPHALALRLEGWRGRWVCTSLDWV